jgi:iron complex outermembrane receptor protein
LKTGSSVSKPVIHGLHSNRVLILNNGIRQEGQQWGSEHAPEIDPFIATQLTVIKGANSVRYGSDAIAGVILVEPAPMPDSAGIRGELNLVGFSNNREGVVLAIAEQRFEKNKALSWRLQEH